MKRIIWWLLGATLTLSPVACSNDDTPDKTETVANLPANTLNYKGKKVKISTTGIIFSQQKAINFNGGTEGPGVFYNLKVPLSYLGKSIKVADINNMEAFEFGFNSEGENGHFGVHIYHHQGRTQAFMMNYG